MALSFRLAEATDTALFTRTADDVFDRDIQASLLDDFLKDPRHHIAVADDDGVVVGFVSAVDHVHPDKPRLLWVNEVSVAPSHRGRGVAKRLLQLMLENARRLGCSEAWVLADADNEAANALYRSVLVNRPVDARSQVMHAFRLD